MFSDRVLRNVSKDPFVLDSESYGYSIHPLFVMGHHEYIVVDILLWQVFCSVRHFELE